MINTSPEPVSNWSASLTEDVLVFSGMWTALNHPEVFLVLFVIFIGFSVWVLPKLWRFIKLLLNKLTKFFGTKTLLVDANDASITTQAHEKKSLQTSKQLPKNTDSE